MFKRICALLSRKPVSVGHVVASVEPAFPVKRKPAIKKAVAKKPTTKKVAAKVTKKPTKKK